MIIDDAEHMMTIYDGQDSHKAILWDTYDRGVTITFHIRDNNDASKNVVNALNFNEWEFDDFIGRLCRLQSEWKESNKPRNHGKEIHPA